MNTILVTSCNKKINNLEFKVCQTKQEQSEKATYAHQPPEKNVICTLPYQL